MTLVGTVFGRLRITGEIKRAGGWRLFCICECGKECSFMKAKVIDGSNRSCGCLRRDRMHKLGVARKGMPATGMAAATPQHFCALYWKVKSPNGQIIEGWNLSYLVRANAHLFDPGDLIWKRGNSECRASKGLRNLFEVTKAGYFNTNSWKGWTAVDRLPWCGNGRRKRWTPVIGTARGVLSA